MRKQRFYITRSQFDYLLSLSSDYKSFVNEEGKQVCGGIHIYFIDRQGIEHNCYIRQDKIPDGLAPMDLFCPNEKGFVNTFYERGAKY